MNDDPEAPRDTDEDPTTADDDPPAAKHTTASADDTGARRATDDDPTSRRDDTGPPAAEHTTASADDTGTRRAAQDPDGGDDDADGRRVTGEHATGTGNQPAPPSRPAPSGRRRLPPRGRDRYLGGVASGVARVLDVDPLAVRLGLVVGALYVPAVVVAYTLAWLAMPDVETGQSLLGAARRRAAGPGPYGPATAVDRWRAPLGVTALGIGGTALAAEMGPGGDGGLRLGVVLLAVGGLIVTGRSSSPDAIPTDAQPTTGGGIPPTEADDGGAGPAPGTEAPGVPGGRRPLVPWPPRPWSSPREPRQPATLGWFGLSALVLLAAVLVMVDRAWEPVKPGAGVSAALLLLGAVLLLATWRGRARLLLPVGVLLVPLWLGFAVTDVPRYDRDGDRLLRVAAGDSFPTRLTHGYGNMEVDLRRASFDDGQRRRLRIGLTSGRVQVDVPREVHVDVQGDVGMGDVNINDHWRVHDSGPLFPGDVSLHAGDPVETCHRDVVFPEPPLPLVPGDPGYPEGVFPEGQEQVLYPDDPNYPGLGTTTTSIVHLDELTGERCRPARPSDDPPELELVLDVGIGIVEVNRV